MATPEYNFKQVLLRAFEAATNRLRVFVGNTPSESLPTSIYDRETMAFNAISPSGNLETAELIRLVGGNFESNLLMHRWKELLTGSGSQTIADGELNLQTGITANSTASVQSFNRAEFTTATFNKSHLAVQIDTTRIDVIYEWGCFDPADNIISGDGVFFRYVNGVFSVVRRKSGVDIEVIPSTSFDFSQGVPDDNVNVYEIVYNAGVIQFRKNLTLLHIIRSLDSAAYETVHLPAALRVENINGNIVDNQISTRGLSISRIGSFSSVPERFSINAATTGIIKNGPGEVLRVVIGTTGVAGATLDLFDGADPYFSIDLTNDNIALELGPVFSENLNFVSSGAGFEVMVVYR